MRSRATLTTVAVVASVLVATGAATPGDASPRPVPARAAQVAAARPPQVVTVKVRDRRTTYAVLEVWSRTTSGYVRVAGPWQARVGRSGVGRAHEGSGRTPAGVFRLGTAFGVGTRDPGTRLGWFTAGSRDWWGSDVRAPSTYNRHVRCARASCPFRTSHAEHLVDYPRAYRYAVLIGYNTPPRVVVGAGSAFFLHVGTGGPTAGCVSLPASRVVRLLRRTTPGAVISIGVGAAAYGPLRS